MSAWGWEHPCRSVRFGTESRYGILGFILWYVSCILCRSKQTDTDSSDESAEGRVLAVDIYSTNYQSGTMISPTVDILVMSNKSIVFAVVVSVLVVSVTGYLYLETDLVDESDVNAETRENPTDVTESEDIDRTGPVNDSDKASDVFDINFSELGGF